MPFAHLKECPLTYNTPWRPAVVQMATPTRELLSDTLKCRNSVQHYDPVEAPEKPVGLEATVREAVRSGNWPSRHEAAQASLCTKGWKEFKTMRASQMMSLKGGAQSSPALRKAADGNDALADLLGINKAASPSSSQTRWKYPENLAKQSGAPGLKSFKDVPGSTMVAPPNARSVPGIPAPLSASAMEDSTPSSPTVQFSLPNQIAAGGTIGSRGFREFQNRGSYSPKVEDAEGKLLGVLKGHYGGQTMWSKEKGHGERPI